MIIAVAKHPEAARRRMVAVRGCSNETLAAISECPVPWTTSWCEPGDDAVFAISAVPIVAKLPGFAGYEKRSKDAIRRYLLEAMSTSKKAELVRLPHDAYPWASLLSTEFTPRRYQLAGMERLWRRVFDPRRSIARGQILKDDVGLGKTVQIAGVFARMIEEGSASVDHPVVVSTSPSTVGQWGEEMRRFVPSLDAPGRVSAVFGDKHARIDRLRPGAVVYVVHHVMLRLPQYRDHIAALFGRAAVVVLDESSAFANHESLTSVCARNLCKRVPFVVATNATPIENKLCDTFGQMSVVDSTVLGGYSCFVPRYIDLHPIHGGEIGVRNLGEFRLRIAGAWFGRRHEDVQAELPEVVSEVRRVPLGNLQRRAYEAALGGFVQNEETGAVALGRLAAVERAALAADESNPASPSAKLDDLLELLYGDLHNHRVLVFTKYRRCAEYAAARMKSLSPHMIHGGVSLGERNSIRIRFCTPGGIGRILIGTEAMARGLNLQDASVVVNLDLPWNHAKLRQRVGRVARIGQKRSSVLVISYAADVGKGPSVDDYFLGKVLAKRDLSDSVYGSDSVDEVSSAPVDVGAVRAYLSGGRGNVPHNAGGRPARRTKP